MTLKNKMCNLSVQHSVQESQNVPGRTLHTGLTHTGKGVASCLCKQSMLSLRVATQALYLPFSSDQVSPNLSVLIDPIDLVWPLSVQ